MHHHVDTNMMMYLRRDFLYWYSEGRSLDEEQGKRDEACSDNSQILCFLNV